VDQHDRGSATVLLVVNLGAFRVGKRHRNSLVVTK
jgi:hypothetical protein